MKAIHYLSRHGRGCDCAHCGDIELANEREAARIDDYIAGQSYEWKRDQCATYRDFHKRAGTMFSVWLRNHIGDMLRNFDDRANHGYY